MLAKSEHYKELTYDLHTTMGATAKGNAMANVPEFDLSRLSQRHMRGEIQDRNGKVLAANRTVCTISVIHIVRLLWRHNCSAKGEKDF